MLTAAAGEPDGTTAADHAAPRSRGIHSTGSSFVMIRADC